MIQTQRVRVQCLPRQEFIGVGIFNGGRFVVGIFQRRELLGGTIRAIELVSYDGMPQRGHVQSNLMHTPCDRLGPDQCVLTKPLQYLEGCLGRTRIDSIGLGCHQDRMAARNNTDRQVHHATVLLQVAVNQGPIRFVDAPGLKVNRQVAVRLMFLGNGRDAARQAIQSMNDTRAQQSGQPGLLIEVKLQGIGQRVILIVATRVSNLADRFVHHNQPRIFVENLHRHLTGRHSFVGRFDQANLDTLSAINA